ncbi:hypothetical protein JW935_09895, partial [candidate division KSB1 bacterium]|nr:hypothetical protein [candidate division KSB1 bacterium]
GAFKALGLRDFARVDIRLDLDGNIFLLEVNSMASLGPTGSYPFAANVAGYDYKSLVNKMVDVAVVRYFAISSGMTEKAGKRLPVHARIRGYLHGRQANIEELLKKMIDINTYVRNIEGVNTLGALLKKELSQLGFAGHTYPQAEIGNVFYFSNTEDPKVQVLLLANLDNKTRIAHQQYFQQLDNKIMGSGVWEHKGGLAVLVAGLQALRFIKQLRNFKVGILLNSDDSLQGRLSKSLVQQKASNADAVIALHGAFLDGGVVTSRSGSAYYTFSMNLIDTLRAEHVPLAVSVLNQILIDWTHISDAESGVVVAPGKIELESNITEPYAHGEVNLSVRFNDPKHMKKIDRKIRQVIPKHKYANVLDFHLEGGPRRPPMLRTDSVIELWKILARIADKLDIRLREEHRWSSADICFLPDNKLKVDGLGPLGEKPMNKSEYILRHSVLERATLLSMAILELSGQE